MADGPEKGQYLALWSYAQTGKPTTKWVKPHSKLTSNQIIMGLALQWITTRDRETRSRLLEIARVQTTQGDKHGLGVVEGKVEGWCLDHHGNYHYLATLSIIKFALEIRDDVMLQAWVRVLDAWLELFSMYSAPDGQVACAGWRAWGFGVKGDELNKILDDDGWHRAKPGGTLSVASDTMNRVWQQLPQLDNKWNEHDQNWMLSKRNEEGSWQPAILLYKLLKDNSVRGMLSDDPPEVIYPVPLSSSRGGSGFEVRMAVEPNTIAPKAWAPATVVRLEYDFNTTDGHKHKVSWYPRVLPPS